MRLLVFEFVTGGGLNAVPLCSSLLQEAYLMRNALLDDLSELTDLELWVLQDERLAKETAKYSSTMQYISIAQGIDLRTFLLERKSQYDAVWLIAPESEGILAVWSQFFSEQGKFQFNSGLQAVTICQDKLETIKRLQKAGIDCVPGKVYDFSKPPFEEKLVIKVNNSVGCDQVYLIESEQDWYKIAPELLTEKTYIIQPYMAGKNMSLSCLFYQGTAYLICCNQQHIRIRQQQFFLTGCTVNVEQKNNPGYHALCQSIANAIPDLFAYVGIDIIENDKGDIMVLEINPRLTTSYAGIKQALGINIAELVLNLTFKDPPLPPSNNQQVFISLDQEKLNANNNSE